MDINFKLVDGVYTANLEGIEEGYSLSKRNGVSVITVNVSAENIDSSFQTLSSLVRTPAFFLLEHGTNANVEKELRKSETDHLHKDILYMDGLNHERFVSIYNRYRKLLINDGGISFGFASHNGPDEVFVGRFKVFTIFTDSPEKYIASLSNQGFKETERLKTVWENFTKDSPGIRRAVVCDGIDIYAMVEALKSEGLYFAERREDI